MGNQEEVTARAEAQSRKASTGQTLVSYHLSTLIRSDLPGSREMMGTEASEGGVPVCEWKAVHLVAVSFHDCLEQKERYDQKYTLGRLTWQQSSEPAGRFRKGQGGSGSSGKKKPVLEETSVEGIPTSPALPAMCSLPPQSQTHSPLASLCMPCVALGTHFVSHIYFHVSPG